MVWSHRVYLNGETSSQVGPVVKNSISASLAIPECMRFNPNGTKLFVLGRNSDAIKEFHLSTAFDLSTISLDSSFSVGSNETSPMNFTFNKAHHREVNYALSNTFGFGGHNACIALKKYS